MINNVTKESAVKLQTIRSSVFEPVNGWNYSHHPSIAFFKGKFWAIWSNGIVHEDAPGQRIMLAESSDGEHWENLRPVITPQMLGDEKKVLTAAGFHQDEEKLTVFYGYYSYKEELLEGKIRPAADMYHKDTGLGYLSSADGITWSEPVDMGIRMTPNQGPKQTKSGRWIISGHTMFLYTDNPNGLEDYRVTGIFGDAFGNEEPVDDSESVVWVSERNGWRTEKNHPAILMESSFFQTDDAVIHMMLRSETDKYCWLSESTDDGETWTSPIRSDFVNDNSKFYFSRLPDGRFYVINNAKLKSNRLPLYLSLSEDGVNFDKQYILRDEPTSQMYAGINKGGSHAYPNACIHEGYMYIIHSREKEAIEVTKLALDQLK